MKILPAPLSSYEAEFQDKTCKYCSAKLSGPALFWGPHDGGYQLPGFDSKQWIYTECPQCEYQWSMGKLGIQQLKHLELENEQNQRQ